MRYCPNPSCPQRRQDVWLGLWWRASRKRPPAEFLDHVAVCSDCGTSLVGEEEAVAAPLEKSAETAPEQSAEAGDDSSEARIDIGTGLVLIALSILLTTATCAANLSTGGGRIFLGVGPVVYGLYRLSRGMNAKKRAPKAEALSAPAAPATMGGTGNDARAWVCLCGTRNGGEQTRCRTCNTRNPY